jgi:hypothetical protein
MIKPWTPPELVVLTRGKAEESVLLVCKGGATGGPLDAFGMCAHVLPGCAGCESKADS